MILKHSESHWVDIDGIVKFKVDYMTQAQDEDIKELTYELGFLAEKGLENLSPSEQAKFMTISEKMFKRTIKYCVKDWQGIEDVGKNPVKCIIKNNEIENKLFESLIRNLSYEDLKHIYECIVRQTEFTEEDKKKSNSSADLETKTD